MIMWGAGNFPQLFPIDLHGLLSQSQLAALQDKMKMAEDGDDGELNALGAIATAMAWAMTNGWHSSSEDLKVAGWLWNEIVASPLVPEIRGEEFLRRLIEAYENTGQDAVNRAILARLVLRASAIDGQP